MIGAIFLDFDGVILESGSAKSEAFQEIFAQFPVHYDDAVRYHMGAIGESRYRQIDHVVRNLIGLEHPEGTVDELAHQFGEKVMARMLSCPVVDGVMDFIKRWHGRLPMYVASLNPQEQLDCVIRARGLEPYFKRVVGGTRTKVEILQSLLKEESLEPREVLFVGDTLPDYRAAAKTGVGFVGRDTEPSFAQLGASTFHSFEEVSELIVASLGSVEGASVPFVRRQP